MVMKTNLDQNSIVNEHQSRTKRIERRRKKIQAIYNLTNYKSYHAFKKANARLNLFFGVLAMSGLISCFMAGRFGAILRELILALLIVYLLSYSWIMTKSRQLRKDSTTALQEMEFESGAYVSSWQLYDGIYNEDNWISLEIAFGREDSYAADIAKLVRRKGKIYPLPEDDIQNLKTMIFNLNQIQDQKWFVYSTLTDQMARNLIEKGFDLQIMEKKYRTKPSRLDYAVATGDWKKAFFKYPKDFSAYAIFVDERKYRKQLKAKQLKKK